MSLYGTVRAALLANSGIAALVGTVPVRITPMQLKDPSTEADFPAITMQMVSTPHLGDHLGGAGTIGQAIMQIDCWGTSIESSDALAVLVPVALAAAMGANFESFTRRDGVENASLLTAKVVHLDCEFNTNEA
jgi:hypothetical protein